jgi:cell division protein FtsB
MMVSLYSAYHLLQGQRGYLELRKIENHSASLTKEIERLAAERGELEDKVVRLRSNQIDIDMLEQQAMYFLGPQSAQHIVLQ